MASSLTGKKTSKSTSSTALHQELISNSVETSSASSYSSACDDLVHPLSCDSSDLKAAGSSGISYQTIVESILPSNPSDIGSLFGIPSISVAMPSQIKHQLTEETVMEDEDETALVDKILPRELLLRVFSFLDVVSLCRAAQVSKAWNSLALDGSNWQSVDLFSFQTEINSPVIQRLSSRTGGFLHALSLRGCRSLTDDALNQLAMSCPNLESLDLNDCKNLTDATCQSIASHCLQLKFLDLSGLSITDISLEYLASSSSLHRRLNHLNLSFCTRLTSNGLLKLLAGPAPLLVQPLDASSISSETGAVVSNGHDNRAFRFSNSWTNGSTNGDAVHHRSFSRSNSFISPFGNLRFFSAKMDLHMITDEAITALVTTAGNSLRTLILNNCNQLTDEGVVMIGSRCSDLMTLALSGCTQLTDAALRALAVGCPDLKTLEIAQCSQITDVGSLARGCHGLTRLDLEELVHLNDATIGVLVSQCLNLTTLTLSHCELITDEALRFLAQAQAANPILKVLELDNCPLITDEGLNHLSRVSSLKRLEIYDCQQLSRQGIRSIASAIPYLKVHAYFAPNTPPILPQEPGADNPADPLAGNQNNRTICRCCSIL